MPATVPAPESRPTTRSDLSVCASSAACHRRTSSCVSERGKNATSSSQPEKAFPFMAFPTKTFFG